MNEKRSDETTPAGSVVPPTTISGEGAAKVEAERHQPDRSRGGCSCGFCAYSVEHVVVMSLRAAVPYIEAGLREQIAAEIEAVTPNAPQFLRYPDEISLQHARDCFLVAARVARGTQEATNGE